jgi:hypothetical protein
LGCNGKHPSDTALISLFQENESSFNKLVEMSNIDSNVVRIAPDFTWLETNANWPRPESQLGFTQERWKEYRTLFQQLHLNDGISRGNDSNGVVILFIAHSSGLVVNGSSKGIVYSQKKLSPLFESLDQNEKLNPDNQDNGIAYRKIQGHWYLYYDWEH